MSIFTPSLLFGTYTANGCAKIPFAPEKRSQSAQSDLDFSKWNNLVITTPGMRSVVWCVHPHINMTVWNTKCLVVGAAQQLRGS